MGRALHRKSIPLGRGTKTRGTGIKYVDMSPPTVALTAEQVAAREQEKAFRQSRRGLRDWNVHCLMRIAGFALDDWEDSVLPAGVDRDYAIERVADKAMTLINTAVTKYSDNSGIEVDRLMQSLNNHPARAKNKELDAALAFVSKRFTRVFDKVMQ
jgi:hypothetical protein